MKNWSVTLPRSPFGGLDAADGDFLNREKFKKFPKAFSRLKEHLLATRNSQSK
ncbi:hypothetical protein FHS27_000067 [Rhodopirellula rubra]|uniref:Uncharacterized protein n=1 Tax=Aporhodopirellula rubra TaxID=980271 RepID=A0A7W5DTK8_9BACT|nr:hypothetical protein [Aporhodopirellula rubra]